MNTEEYITAEWRLVQMRNFLCELLGLRVSHFVVAFETEDGDQGVVYTHPRALHLLDAREIASKVTAKMKEEGRSILRVKTPVIEP